jgi:hypothetical protein
MLVEFTFLHRHLVEAVCDSSVAQKVSLESKIVVAIAVHLKVELMKDRRFGQADANGSGWRRP